MKIGIDISQIVYHGTGVAKYTTKLVENLLSIDKKNEYVLFFSSLRGTADFSFLQGNNYALKRFKMPPLFLEQVWNNFHFLPVDKFVGKVDVYHSSDWTQPSTKAKKVTTIHDLSVFTYPENFRRRGGHDIVANQKRRLEWVKKEVDLVIADSEATKRDIINYLRIPEKKIKVVYLAADDNFRIAKPEQITQVKKKYHLEKPYLLCVGAIEPRKNLKGVISAFEKICKDKKNLDLELVIAGKFAWGEGLKISIGIKDRVKVLGFIPQEDLPSIYAGASCFVYPSFYEGFGLPVLEAMSCGCPVVTSNCSSLPEVAGNAGVLVNPKSDQEIARGILLALEKNKELRQKGLAQALKFSWEKTAKETLAVYREAAKGKLNFEA